MVLVSVIIPTYNRCHVLERALSSVMRQTYKNYEIIVVDDASEDNTIDLLSSLNMPEICYLKHEKNLGQNAARNTGIYAAKGEYLAFLDSDDEWLPEFLEKCVHRFSVTPLVDNVYTCAWIEKNGHRSIADEFCLEGELYRDALAQGYVSHMITLVTKRQTALAIGLFDSSFNVCDDDDFCLRLARSGSFGLIREPLAVIHVDGGNQTTSDPQEYAEGFNKLISKFELEIERECGSARLAAHFEKCGDLFWLACNYGKALESYNRAGELMNSIRLRFKLIGIKLRIKPRTAVRLKSFIQGKT